MKLLLIDGNSVLFRAYYATAYGQMMKTSNGIYTNAVFAFANMLNKALKMIEPDYCAVAFDKGKHTFRHDLAPDYKGGRKQTPDELVGQFSIARELVNAFGIPYFEFDDIEADDIIGSLAKAYPLQTCILSSDHDLLQLIDDTTSVYVMKKGMSDIEKVDEAALLRDYGLKPYQIIDFKGLSGDKSDNIKGVEGVGEKTAVKLLNQYDTCECIYEHIEEIKGKLKEKLIKDQDSCFLSKTLATIKTDLHLDIELDNLKIIRDTATLNAFFAKYEMRSLIVKDDTVSSKINGRKVSTVSEKFLQEGTFINFITDGFSYYHPRLSGVCFVKDGECEFIAADDFLLDLNALDFIASDKRKAVYDLKAIKHLADNYNFNIGQATDDVLLMSFLSNSNDNDLTKILARHNKNLLIDAKEAFGTVKKPLEIDEIKLLDYSYELSSALAAIYQEELKNLQFKNLEELYFDLELPLVNALYEMEKNGIACDEAELDMIAGRTLELLDILSDDIYRLAGHEFNINSPSQIANVLYKELQLPDFKKGSTSAEVLAKLIDYHPIVEKILEFRKYSKLYSTYAEGLKKYIAADGRIHTIFTQTVTATGRLSSAEPNLQNISVRDDESKEIRKAFKAKEGYVLMSSDYSQIELRVLAALAHEEKMIDAFNQGIDIHTLTAMNVFHLSKEEVTPQIRRQAKAVNFGVVYGISDYGLANQTSMTFGSAKRFIDDYFKTYPAIKAFLDEQIAQCKEHGYVETIMHRRRYIDEINSTNWQLKEFGKRAAMNSPIQGSAADIIKIAMLKVYNSITAQNLKSRLILQVHDELILEVPDEEIDIMKDLLRNCMSSAYELAVKLDCSLSYGKSWYEAK